MSILKTENISGFLRTVDGSGYFGHGSYNLLAAFSRLYPEYADQGVEYSTHFEDLLDITYVDLMSYYRFGHAANKAEQAASVDDYGDEECDAPCEAMPCDPGASENSPVLEKDKLSAKTQEVLDALSQAPISTLKFRFYVEKTDEFEAKIKKLGFRIISGLVEEFSDFVSYQKFIVAHENEPFFVSVFHNNRDIPSLSFIHCGTGEMMKKYVDLSDLADIIREHIKVVPYNVKATKKGATCHMIGINELGNLQLYQLNKVVCDLDQELIKKSYPNVNEEKISDFFKNPSPNGKLLLFHGIPGSGKTTYIRHLLSNVFSGKVVFVNAEIFSKLTSASFIPFAIQNLQKSLLLIEDAEQLLVSRGQDHTDRNSSVADLLNYTDGLLGDALNLKVLATFNTSVQEIDSALLRKGRLNHREEFSHLDKKQAEDLFKHLTGEDVNLEDKAYSLADIYGLLPDE